MSNAFLATFILFMIGMMLTFCYWVGYCAFGYFASPTEQNAKTLRNGTNLLFAFILVTPALLGISIFIH